MLKKTIFSKIFGLLFSISFILGILIFGLIFRERTKFLERQLLEENKLLAETAAITVEASYLANVLPFTILKKIAEAPNISFLWLVKPNGEIYYANDPQEWGKKIEDPFLKTKELKFRDSLDPETKEKIFLFASPLIIETKEKPWTLFLGVSKTQLIAAKKIVILQGLLLFLSSLSLFSLVSFYFSKKIVLPLRELHQGAEIIGKGNLDYRVKIKTGDEIEQLANEFNRMTESLKRSKEELEEAKTILEIKVKARTKELRELADTLDEQVKERTKELREKMEELEKFHKLAVGRELKMIELKEEIKKLKEEVAKSKGRSS